MLEVRFDVYGEQQYARRFKDLGTRLDDLTEPLERVRDHLARSVADQFDDEGGHGGPAWVPLNPDYERRKRAAVGDKPILEYSGAMRGALDADHGTVELTSQRLVFGLTTQRDQDGELIADRGRAHQTGAGVPERKWLALSEEDRRDIDRVFVEWISAQSRALFGLS